VAKKKSKKTFFTTDTTEFTEKTREKLCGLCVLSGSIFFFTLADSEGVPCLSMLEQKK
jgi:hypothetical protein